MSQNRYQRELTDYEAIQQDLEDSLDTSQLAAADIRKWAKSVIKGAEAKYDFSNLIDALGANCEINESKIERYLSESDSLKKLELLQKMNLMEQIRVVQSQSSRNSDYAYRYLLERLNFYDNLIEGKRVKTKHYDSDRNLLPEPITQVEEIDPDEIDHSSIQIGVLRDVMFSAMIGTPEIAILKIASKRAKDKNLPLGNLPALKGYKSGIEADRLGNYTFLNNLYERARRNVSRGLKDPLDEKDLEHRAVIRAANWLEEATKYNSRGPESPYSGSIDEAVSWARLSDPRVRGSLRGMRKKIRGIDLSGISRFIGRSGHNKYRRDKAILEKEIEGFKKQNPDDPKLAELEARLSEVTINYHRHASLAERAIDLYFKERELEGGKEAVPVIDWINKAPLGLINWTYNAIHRGGVKPATAFGYAKAKFLFPDEIVTRGLIEAARNVGSNEAWIIPVISKYHQDKEIPITSEEICILSRIKFDLYKELIEKHGYTKDALISYPWLIQEATKSNRQPFPFDKKRGPQEAWCAQNAFYLPSNWNQKRLGALILQRLESGIDPNIHDASFWLKDFEVPEKSNGIDYFSVKTELDFLYSITDINSELKRRLPTKPSKYSELFSSEATRMIYECLLPIVGQGKLDFKEFESAVLDSLAAYKTDKRKARSLSEPFESFAKKVKMYLESLRTGLLDRHDPGKFPLFIGKLREMAKNRAEYINMTQAWLSTHGSTPHDLLTFAWSNRELALSEGCADNPRAIKQWADLNGLRASYDQMNDHSELPENITRADLLKYSTWFKELVRCYDGRTAIRAVSKLKEVFNPDCEIMPMKIDLGDGWEGEILRKNDPRGLTIGFDTGCCMTLGGKSESCIQAGYEKAPYGFFVLSRHGNLVAQSFLYTNRFTGPNTIVVDNIEANEGRDLANVRGKYQDFFQRYLKTQTRRARQPRYTEVNIGEGYSDVGLSDLPKVDPIQMPDYNIYTDADNQRRLLELDSNQVERLRKYTVEVAKPSEWNHLKDEILNIELSAFEGKGYSEAQLREEFMNPKNIVILMKDGDKVVGYSTALHMDEKTLYVSSTALLPSHQGKGLVSDMMYKMDLLARERGYEEYERYTRSDNGYAEKLSRNYEVIKMGNEENTIYGKQRHLRLVIPDHRLPDSMLPNAAIAKTEAEKQKSDFELAPITHRQADLIAELERQIYPPALRVGVQELEDEMENAEGNASFLINEKEGGEQKPIGYAIAYIDESAINDGEEVLYINDIAMLPESQRKGYGKHALMSLMRYAEQRNLPIEFHAREQTSYKAIMHSEPLLSQLGYEIIHDELIEDYFEDAPEEDRDVHLIRIEKVQSKKMAA